MSICFQQLKDYSELGYYMAAIVGVIIILITLIQLVRSNRQLTRSINQTSLYNILSEMNKIRQVRFENPEIEKKLFPSRKDWNDEKVKKYLLTLQMANVFEWVYIARRQDLISYQEWESWIKTWREVIVDSEELKAHLSDTVWTFARQDAMQRHIRSLFDRSLQITDPRNEDC